MAEKEKKIPRTGPGSMYCAVPDPVKHILKRKDNKIRVDMDTYKLMHIPEEVYANEEVSYEMEHLNCPNNYIKKMPKKCGENLNNIHLINLNNNKIRSPPEFLHNNYDDVINATEGDDVMMGCAAKGNPLPSVTWYKNGDELDLFENERLKIVDGGMMILGVKRGKDDGLYECVISNLMDSITSNITLHVFPNSASSTTSSSSTSSTTSSSTSSTTSTPTKLMSTIPPMNPTNATTEISSTSKKSTTKQSTTTVAQTTEVSSTISQSKSTTTMQPTTMTQTTEMSTTTITPTTTTMQPTTETSTLSTESTTTMEPTTETTSTMPQTTEVSTTISQSKTTMQPTTMTQTTEKTTTTKKSTTTITPTTEVSTTTTTISQSTTTMPQATETTSTLSTESTTNATVNLLQYEDITQGSLYASCRRHVNRKDQLRTATYRSRYESDKRKLILLVRPNYNDDELAMPLPPSDLPYYNPRGTHDHKVVIKSKVPRMEEESSSARRKGSRRSKIAKISRVRLNHFFLVGKGCAMRWMLPFVDIWESARDALLAPPRLEADRFSRCSGEDEVITKPRKRFSFTHTPSVHLGTRACLLVYTLTVELEDGRIFYDDIDFDKDFSDDVTKLHNSPLTYVMKPIFNHYHGLTPVPPNKIIPDP